MNIFEELIMLKLNDEIIVKTNDDSKKLNFYTKYLVQEHFTFDIFVLSDSFSGKSSFCISKSNILSFINSLKEMNNILSGSAIINDNDSDSFLNFMLEEYGELKIIGQIGGSHNDHFLKFTFKTDQTTIKSMINDFTSLLEYKE
jgi:hypothetical protein